MYAELENSQKATEDSFKINTQDRGSHDYLRQQLHPKHRGKNLR